MGTKKRHFRTTPKRGGYIEQSRGEGEKICAIAEFHWWYTFAAYFWLVVGLIVIGFFIWLPLMIRKWTTEIAVTSHRFVYKTGLIVRNTNEISLMNIESVRITQGVWGRLLGFGRLRLEGTGVGVVDLPDIADPVGFRAAILDAKEEQRQERAKAQ